MRRGAFASCTSLLRAAALRLAVLLGISVMALPAGQAVAGAHDDIVAAIAARGRASVIVTVAVDRQESVSEAVNTARIALAQSGIAIDQTFENIPQLVATVTAQTLSVLEQEPHVRSIALNRPRMPNAVSGTTTATVPPGTTDAIRYIRADAAWARGATGRGQIVVVIDDGIDDTHEMFAGKIATEACFSPALNPGDQSLCPGAAPEFIGAGAASTCPSGTDACRHGTHVAGTAAGASATLRGVAYEAQLLPIQVFTLASDTSVCGNGARCLTAYDSALLAALDFVISQAAIQPIAAVNISVGGGAPSPSACDAHPLKPGIDRLRGLGIVTVIAAGNEGRVGAVDPPGCITAAWTVSSVSAADPDPATNQSPMVDMLAPGTFITSAVPGGYLAMSGSSMATAHVSGAIALLKSAIRGLAAGEIEAALRSGGIATRGAGWTWTTPRLDVNAALNVASGSALAPSGVGIIGVRGSRDPALQSFIRIANTDTAPSPVAVSVYNARTGSLRGVWSKTIPGGAAPQFSVGTIEQNAVPAIAPDADALYVMYVSSPLGGFVQHVLWNAAAGLLSDVTACAAGPSRDARVLMDVHTARLADFPSFALVQNTGATAATPRFSIHDAESGLPLGTFLADAAVPALGTATIALADVLRAVGLEPAPDQTHINVILDPAFTGFAQHLVGENRAQTLADMSTKCDL